MSLKRKSEELGEPEKQEMKKVSKKDSLGKVVSKKTGPGQQAKGKKLTKDTAATRRERKLSRKMQKPHFELSRETLKMWEKLRIHKTKMSQKEKSNLVDQLLKTIKKQDLKFTTFAYAHDTSRVLQSCLKQASVEQREVIFNELKDDIVGLSKNQYSKNVVWKLLKYGSPSQRDHIIRQFAGVVPKLIRKPAPASIIEFAYNIYANKDQRNFLVHQLYGNSFNIAKSTESSTLEEVFQEQPEKKGVILKNFKQSLLPLINKQVISHTLVHRVFSEFFMHCDTEDQLRTEMVELLRESVIHMVHTRDGAHVGMHCLWHGTAKDRKVIVKTMKEFISKLCQEEYGHLVVLAAFDCVDDTVFLNKALISQILKLLPEIIGNKYARKVLIYLLTPRNKSHFLPETIAFLSKGDNNKHSKKPMETRHKELTECSSPSIVSYVKENLDTLVRDRSMFTLVETVIRYSPSNLTELMSALISLISVPFEAGKKSASGKMHIIEEPTGHLLIKHIVSLPKEPDKAHFASMMLESIKPETLCSWSSCNRGNQVLLSLLKSPDHASATAAKKLMKRHIGLLKENSHIKSTELILQNLAK